MRWRHLHFGSAPTIGGRERATEILRGNLWSRAPAYRPAQTGGRAWPEALDQRRRAGPVPVHGRVPGAGCRCAGGAPRCHRRETSAGLVSRGLPGEVKRSATSELFLELSEGALVAAAGVTVLSQAGHGPDAV